MFLRVGLAAILMAFSVLASAQRGTFMSADELRELAYPGQPMSWQTLWVTGEQRASMEAILDHSFRSLRVRYWGKGQRTTWVFEEIGKELPITFGVIVEHDSIVEIVVMEYRESRGGEVRYPFFTQQFKGLGLNHGDNYGLNSSIDGITGATLSVRAMKKIATLALFCHQLTPFAQVEHVEQASQS
ncbi:MAG: FMN-binding protein [Cellvibrionaceae bacterium]|nr:FMN-binding protein [Cellvibrionaceae bacterium]|tara:strand:- start:291 stop:848 length:558 start_codon:yes stop_codon:yes gene_type:complete